MTIRDLSSDDLPADLDPRALGREPFLLRPGRFAVVDGDTIWALPSSRNPKGPRGEKAFSMRFRSIAAPEKPKRRATDSILKAGNIDPNWDSAGKEATKLLKTYLHRRALLVEPTGGIDPYGRMLCDMAVVPYTGSEPDVSRAMSLERLTLHAGVVSPFRDEVPPPVHPRSVAVPDDGPGL